ncbi:MAG: hypothetical protein V4732_04055 [Pseudomonadota bacterium]
MQKYEFQNRIIYFGSPQASVPVDFTPPFAVLLPASNRLDLLEAEAIIVALLETGCIEFCCVGSEAELLHDSIDSLIEDRAAFDVVTTFHLDEIDACEYFLFAAGGGVKSLLALVASHPKLVSRLQEEIATLGNP